MDTTRTFLSHHNYSSGFAGPSPILLGNSAPTNIKFADSRHPMPRIDIEDELYEPLDEEMVMQAIGGVLPEDDPTDSVADGFEMLSLSNATEENEYIDIFSSGGGLEMDGDFQGEPRKKINNSRIMDDIIPNRFNAVSSVHNEQPYVEHPSRTLFVRSINSSVEDSELRALFDPFGDIRSLYTACKHRGFVMVSYFDIRAARNAMRTLQNKQLRNKKLDIHFSFPKDNPSDKDINQGTLVIFNLDPSVSNDYLHELFGKYGEIKEIRETPHKSHHKFIEFYDVRDAESALRGLNRAVIGGKRIKLEPSRPGGTQRSFTQHHTEQLEQEVSYGSYDAQSNSSMISFSPGPWEQLGTFIESAPLGSVHTSPKAWSNHLRRNCQNEIKQLPPYHAHSLPEYNDIMSVYSRPPPSPQPIRSQVAVRTDSLNFHGLGSIGHAESQPSSYAGTPNYTINNFVQRPTVYYSGSPTSGNPLYLEKQFSYHQQSPDTPLYGPGSFGSGISARSAAIMSNLTPPNPGPREGFVRINRYNMALSSSPISKVATSPTGSINYDGSHGRTQRFDGGSNQSDSKKLYELDLNRIMLGEDTRTTLMIKNIPNKYTKEMLLEAIDKTHIGKYDFLYLPIDFKNNCNVGYAFINMTLPCHIISLYEALEGKKWERFNSEKVASLAYARIQGRAALDAHFQNSSLMNEDKRCQPVVF